MRKEPIFAECLEKMHAVYIVADVGIKWADLEGSPVLISMLTVWEADERCSDHREYTDMYCN